MKKTVANEKTEMKKYIVEAPKPKQGQKVSSGGIRENGKLAVQFKNPVPYEEPALPVAMVEPRKSRKDGIKRQVTYLAWGYGGELLGYLWNDFLSPILQAKVHELGVRTVEAIEEKGRHAYDRRNIEKIIDAESVEVALNHHDDIDDEKVIRFPGKSAV